MTDEPEKTDDELDEDAEARAFILARRARFVAAALAGITTAACGGDVRGFSACLSVKDPDASMSGQGGVSIGGGPGSGGFQVCLSAPAGGSFNTAGVGPVGYGGQPQVCLEAPAGGSPNFAGFPGAGGMPQACLGALPSGGTFGAGGAGGTTSDMDGGTDAAAGQGGEVGVPPQVCLRIPQSSSS